MKDTFKFQYSRTDNACVYITFNDLSLMFERFKDHSMHVSNSLFNKPYFSCSFYTLLRTNAVKSANSGQVSQRTVVSSAKSKANRIVIINDY